MNRSFSKLTRYVPRLESGESFAAVVREDAPPGVTVLPAIEYAPLAKAIVSDFYAITESCPAYGVDRLLAAYERSPFAETALTEVAVDGLDAASVLALLATVLHEERWDSGTLYSFYHSGKLLECLKRLAALA